MAELAGAHRFFQQEIFPEGTITTIMLERFCFPYKVAKRLSKLGWSFDVIPRNDVTFVQLCDALKLGGYDAERAAHLWHLVFTGDIAGRQELRANTGLHGAAFLGDNGEWRGMAGSSFFFWRCIVLAAQAGESVDYAPANRSGTFAEA